MDADLAVLGISLPAQGYGASIWVRSGSAWLLSRSIRSPSGTQNTLRRNLGGI